MSKVIKKHSLQAAIGPKPPKRAPSDSLVGELKSTAPHVLGTRVALVSRESDKFMLRFPDGMRERIAEVAEINGRSMNAEIIARIEASFEQPAETQKQVALLEEHVNTLRRLAELERENARMLSFIRDSAMHVVSPTEGSGTFLLRAMEYIEKHREREFELAKTQEVDPQTQSIEDDLPWDPTKRNMFRVSKAPKKLK